MTGRGRALPPVRWLSELHCARVLRAGRAQRTSQTQVSPETPVWHHRLSCPQCAVYSLPTHPPPNPHPLNRIYLQCNRTPGRGRALPPVRWLSELHCARVLRAGRAQRTSQTAFNLVLHYPYEQTMRCPLTRRAGNTLSVVSWVMGAANRVKGRAVVILSVDATHLLMACGGNEGRTTNSSRSGGFHMCTL